MRSAEISKVSTIICCSGFSVTADLEPDVTASAVSDGAANEEAADPDPDDLM
jgi:hypothetical protein